MDFYTRKKANAMQIPIKGSGVHFFFLISQRLAPFGLFCNCFSRLSACQFATNVQNFLKPIWNSHEPHEPHGQYPSDLDHRKTLARATPCTIFEGSIHQNVTREKTTKSYRKYLLFIMYRYGDSDMNKSRLVDYLLHSRAEILHYYDRTANSHSPFRMPISLHLCASQKETCRLELRRFTTFPPDRISVPGLVDSTSLSYSGRSCTAVARTYWLGNV